MLRFIPLPLPPGINLPDDVHVKDHTLFKHELSLFANYSYYFSNLTLNTLKFYLNLDYDTRVNVQVPWQKYPHLINSPDTEPDQLSL